MDAALAALDAALARGREILERQAARRLSSQGADGGGPEAAGMIEVAALLDRVQAELLMLKMGIGPLDGRPSVPLAYPHSPDSVSLDDLLQRELTAADLLDLHDEVFVRFAYRALLIREPDPAGKEFFLQTLRDGRISKRGVLRAMRRSREGRASPAVVRGLDEAIKWEGLRSLPLIGYVVRGVEELLRLPMRTRDRERIEAAHFRWERTAFDNVLAVVLPLARVVHVVVDGVNALQSADEKRRTNIRGLARHLMELRDRVGALAESCVPRPELQAMGQAARDGLSALNAAVAGLEQMAGAAAQTRAQVEQVGIGLRNAGAQIADLTSGLHGFAAETRGELKALGEGLGNAGTQIADLTSGLHGFAAEARGEMKALGEGLGNAGTQIADLTSGLHGFAAETRGQAQAANDAILDQQRRIARLLHDLSSAGAPGSRPARKQALDAHEARLLDALYSEFERRFRGDRAEIKRRVAVYLPVIRDAGAVSKRAPLLDIGCGRGEWLELLRDEAIPAAGIDLSAVSVEGCTRLGLQATEAEALQHLRGLKDGKLGAVTAMHVVEHLAFRDLVALLDESYRVLQPGGVAIFETPNPENLIVGACSFWLDPTHVKPLPPETLRFLAEARGFTSVEVLKLHPYPEGERLGVEGVPAQLDELLYGPRDYAIIARKPVRKARPA